MNQVVKTPSPAEVMENVLIRGDLSQLTPEEKGKYYTAICTSVGLNPLTKPFEYIVLNGKLRLYALKDCTDQLRSIHGISVTEMTESEREGVFIVKTKVANSQGRTDMSTGAVNIANLKGEALANALMKAETKAKRRATLSICGLGLLDETEVDDIPASQKAPAERPRVPSPTDYPVNFTKPMLGPAPVIDPVDQIKPHKIVGGTYETWANTYIAAIQSADDPSVVMAWIDANQPQLDKLTKGSFDDAARVKTATAKHIEFLRKTSPTTPSEAQAPPLDDMAGETTVVRPKPANGRRKPKEPPSFAKDYDGWLKFYLDAIAKAEDPDKIEGLFDEMEPEWINLMPPDKESLLGARREAESRLEQ